MEVSDEMLVSNLDWDPVYLRLLFEEDFDDFTELWQSNVSDMDLVSQASDMEKYCPVVEDISMEDEVLYSAVERIEKE